MSAETSDLDRDGYVVVPVLAADDVAALRWAFERIGPAPEAAHVGVLRTSESEVAAYRDAAGAAVRDVLSGRAPGPVVDAGFGVTWPGPLGGVGLHRGGDLAELTVALDDPWDGAAEWWVVPRSHQRAGPEPAGAAERLVQQHSRRIVVPAGHGLLAHPGLLRFSTPNRSDRPNLVAHALVDVPVRRRRLVRRGQVDSTGEAGPERLNPELTWCRRCGSAVVGADPPHPLVGRVLATCDDCRAAPLPDWVEAEVDGPATVPAADLSTVPTPGWDAGVRPGTNRPVLVDPALDAQLRRDGYVRLPTPVLTAGEAAALRAGFGAAHGWEGDGFHNAFNDRDRTYRERSSALIAAALDDRAAAHFTGHRAFIRPYLCKYPGEASYFEPHRDWMYVDERAGAESFVFFVALEDVDADNGQLLMLPGSHRLDDMLRGTHLQAPWLRHHDLLRRHMVPIALRAGEGAIWNHALVHGSEPNRTSTPRLAAALWVRAEQDPLVHYRRVDEASSARFEVDEAFFEAMDPYVLMVAPPRSPATAVVPVGGTDLTEAELNDRLARR
jgi:hypothetical protein